MLSYPISAFLEITEACNLKCIHCYNNSGEIFSQMDEQKVIEIIDDLQMNGAIAITLSGGEPLLHTGFERILDHISTNTTLKVAINSNGHLLNSEKIQYLKNCGISDVQISIDGDEHVHEVIRGLNTYRKTINSIKQCIHNGIKVKVGMTINKLNYKLIRSITYTLREFGVSSIAFYRYIPTSKRDINKKLDLLPEELLIISKELISLSKELQTSVFQIYYEKLSFFCFLHDESLLKSSNCLAGIAQLNVDCDNNVSVCAHLKNKAFNLNRGIVKDIWADQNKMIDELKIIPVKCEKCKYSHICKGGCKAFSFNQTGRYDSKDEGCFINLL